MRKAFLDEVLGTPGDAKSTILPKIKQAPYAQRRDREPLAANVEAAIPHRASTIFGTAPHITAVVCFLYRQDEHQVIRPSTPVCNTVPKSGSSNSRSMPR
jgi:hypothetical protein